MQIGHDVANDQTCLCLLHYLALSTVANHDYGYFIIVKHKERQRHMMRPISISQHLLC